MSDSRSAFLAGDRLDDVALFLADSYVSDDRLAAYGDPVDGGVLIVVDGERGRGAFKAATGTDAMAFAKEAMAADGEIERDLAGGRCPEATEIESSGGPVDETATDSIDTADERDERDEHDDHDEHDVQYLFAFAEAQNDEVGGIYAEGDVIHAYARCSCGAAFSDRWTA